jgi:hypothetical protein
MEAELTFQESPSPDRMVEIKAQYLGDVISGIRELIYLMECHPNSYSCYGRGHPDRDVQRRISELAGLSTLFSHSIEEQLRSNTAQKGPSLDGMVQVKARYLADAEHALHGLSCNIEWHAETYRGLRGYCHPEIQIPRRQSEVGWLWFLLRNIIADNQDRILKLEQEKDEPELQPVEEYSCDAAHAYLEGSDITQDDKGATKDKQMTGKMLCDGQRALGLLLRALGAYGEERGPRDLNELIAKGQETWEQFLKFFGQTREQWYEQADEVFFALYDANDADEESLKAEIQRLVELTKAKGILAVATELKISRGTLISWIEEWNSPSQRNLAKIRSYLQTWEALAKMAIIALDELVCAGTLPSNSEGIRNYWRLVYQRILTKFAADLRFDPIFGHILIMEFLTRMFVKQLPEYAEEARESGNVMLAQTMEQLAKG